MKFIELFGFVFLLSISPSLGTDDCRKFIATWNIQSNVEASKIFLFQHIKGQVPIKHALPDAHISISNSLTFDKTKTILLYINGWLPSTLGSSDNKNMIESLEDNNLSNVFILDWKFYADSINYPKAVVNSKKIGELLGTTLAQLEAITGCRFHLIGHSLGAHMAGFAGKTFYKIRSKKIDRITGLDPANPCFNNEAAPERLDKFDASFVDVVHTSGVAGMTKSIGLCDFRPNGGLDMPGLSTNNHGACIKYFGESIKNDNFLSAPCSSWDIFKNGECRTNIPQVKMGFYVDTSARGDYYLRTNTSSPYALGTAGLT